KECISECPRIQAELAQMSQDQIPEIAAGPLLAACVESYSCPGPREGIIESKVGIFRNRTVSELGFICGLPE
ncbi:MAG: hypothetical protein WCO19_04450, partial [Candidatus Saccharibacteria bacterium]